MLRGSTRGQSQMGDSVGGSEGSPQRVGGRQSDCPCAGGNLEHLQAAQTGELTCFPWLQTEEPA